MAETRSKQVIKTDHLQQQLRDFSRSTSRQLANLSKAVDALTERFVTDKEVIASLRRAIGQLDARVRSIEVGQRVSWDLARSSVPYSD